MSLTLRRIERALTARDRAQSEWFRNYWDNVASELRKKLN